MEENKFNQIINSEQFAMISDLSEVALDSFTDNEILKDIPLIGTAVKLLNIGNTINDRIFVNKLIKFLKQLDNFENGTVLKEIQYLDDSKIYNYKVGEKILEIINRIDSDGKPEITGRLFRNFIDKKISYPEFLKLTNIVEKAFYYDLILLNNCSPEGKLYIDLDEELYNLGLIQHTGIGLFSPTEEEKKELDKTKYLITERGAMLLEYGLKC